VFTVHGIAPDMAQSIFSETFLLNYPGHIADLRIIDLHFALSNTILTNSCSASNGESSHSSDVSVMGSPEVTRCREGSHLVHDDAEISPIMNKTTASTNVGNFSSESFMYTFELTKDADDWCDGNHFDDNLDVPSAMHAEDDGLDTLSRLSLNDNNTGKNPSERVASIGPDCQPTVRPISTDVRGKFGVRTALGLDVKRRGKSREQQERRGVVMPKPDTDHCESVWMMAVTSLL
jgi:hypothetical protein